MLTPPLSLPYPFPTSPPVQTVELHTDERHAKRSDYDADAAKRRAAKEAEEAKRRAEAEERDRVELAAMRRKAAFKAKPVSAAVLEGRPVAVRAVAKKAVTIAMSPHFATTSRLLARRAIKAQVSADT